MVPKGWRFCKLADISRVTSGERLIGPYLNIGKMEQYHGLEPQKFKIVSCNLKMLKNILVS